jgi:hypothetical protein
MSPFSTATPSEQTIQACIRSRAATPDVSRHDAGEHPRADVPTAAAGQLSAKSCHESTAAIWLSVSPASGAADGLILAGCDV